MGKPYGDWHYWTISSSLINVHVGEWELTPLKQGNVLALFGFVTKVGPRHPGETVGGTNAEEFAK